LLPLIIIASEAARGLILAFARISKATLDALVLDKSVVPVPNGTRWRCLISEQSIHTLRTAWTTIYNLSGIAEEILETRLLFPVHTEMVCWCSAGWDSNIFDARFPPVCAHTKNKGRIHWGNRTEKKSTSFRKSNQAHELPSAGTATSIGAKRDAALQQPLKEPMQNGPLLKDQCRDNHLQLQTWANLWSSGFHLSFVSDLIINTGNRDNDESCLLVIFLLERLLLEECDPCCDIQKE